MVSIPICVIYAFHGRGWGVVGVGVGVGYFMPQSYDDIGGRGRKFRTFADRGSSHRRQSAALLLIDMVYLYRSPITVARWGDILLLQMISTCHHVA
jgi:hypothetical protein